MKAYIQSGELNFRFILNPNFNIFRSQRSRAEGGQPATMSVRQITFPYRRDNRCTVNLDFDGREYLLQWDGDWQRIPDLTQFPSVPNGTVTGIAHSPKVDEIWMTSDVLKFGADAHLRESRTVEDNFPVCKVAINAHQRCLLRDEFFILRFLSTHGLPVVRSCSEPLVDEEGIFGYRMEKLIDIDMDNATKYVPEIEEAVAAIHSVGVALYDISPSNIMLDMQGRITMIDFGRAGYIGEEIPSCKVIGTDPTTKVFSPQLDSLALNSVIGMLNPFGNDSKGSSPRNRKIHWQYQSEQIANSLLGAQTETSARSVSMLLGRQRDRRHRIDQRRVVRQPGRNASRFHDALAQKFKKSY